MNVTESMLDQLHQLQQKRATEILEKGRPYQLANTEKTVQGLMNSTQTSIKFIGTQMFPGQILAAKTKAGTVEYFITGITNKAGCQEADVLPVIGYGEIYQKHLTPSPDPNRPAAVSLKSTSARMPILKFEGNQLVVPKHYASVAGRIIKHAGMELEAVNARFDGCTAILEVRQYRAPVVAAPQGKTFQPTTSRPSAPVSVKFYGGYYQ